MKNYEEVTNDLLERRNRYVVEQKRKKKRVTEIITSLCCVCLVALVGIGVWQSGILTDKNMFLKDDIKHKTEDYTAEGDQNNSTGEYEGGYLNQENGSDNTGMNGSDGNANQIKVEEDRDTSDELPIISSYECGVSASYVAPENGNFGLSEPLKDAINEYGDTVRYMVIVDIFRDEDQLSPDKALLEAEIKRLNDLGYETILLKEPRDDQEVIYHLGIQATADQIHNFNCNEKYGYFLFIRSERIDSN